MKAEVVRTAAGWHGRIRADNGEPVWTTEVLTSAQLVVSAIELLPLVDPQFDVIALDERDPADEDDTPQN